MRSKHIKTLFSFAMLLLLAGRILPVAAFAAEDEDITSMSEVNYSGANYADEPEIVEEIVALRAGNEKHFRMSDGSYAAMQYMNPVHFKDSDGNWKDIRNTLSSGTYRGQRAYTLQAGNVSKAFAASVESSFVFGVESYGCVLELCLCGQSIKFDSAGNTNHVEVGETGANQITGMGTIEGAVSELAYQDMLPGVKLYYSNAGFDTTESIIIAERQDNYIYRFDLNLAELEANQTEDGSLCFTNPYGELIFKIHAPYLVDYAGAVSEKVEYAVEYQDGRLILTITADSDWMNLPNRIYPVTLSSLIECSPGISDTAIKATHVSQGSPNVGRGAGEELYLGYSCSDAVDESKVFVSSEDFPSLPKGAEIISAQFSLCQTSYSDVLCEEASIGLYSTDIFHDTDNSKDRLRSLTWETRASAHSKLAETICSKDTSGKALVWDITDYARNWYEKGGTTQTFALQLENIQDYSKTHAMIITLKGGRALDAPLLTVRYTAETFEERITEKYHQLSAGAAGTAYINRDANELIITGTDLLIQGSENFTLGRVYNFERGDWRSSLCETVEAYALGSSKGLVYTDNRGTEHVYLPSGMPEIFSESGGNGQIQITSESGKEIVVLTDSVGNVRKFLNGCLVTHTDAGGKTLLFAYDNKYSSENDNWQPKGIGKGQVVQLLTAQSTGQDPTPLAELEYENDGLLSRILCHGEEISYKYTPNWDGKLRLTGVESSLGAVVEYQYDLNGRLNRAIDSSRQIGVGITYTEGGEISRIFEFTQPAGTEAPVPGEIIVFKEDPSAATENLLEENNNAVKPPL